MEDVIGKKVIKQTKRPFKSQLRINTIKGIIEHPITKRPAYTFYEDDSYVEVRMCDILN
jgi:hypothetical protein